MEFKIVEDYGNIAVSKTGIVKNVSTGNLVRIFNDKDGYERVSFRDIRGTSRTVSVHRLVAKTYLPNPNKRQMINHIDGVKNNNNVENLEWSTPRENTIHAYENNLCTTNVDIEVTDLESNTLKHYRSIQSFSKEIGVNLKLLVSYIKHSEKYPFNNRYIIKVFDENRLLESNNGGSRRRIYIYDIVEDKQLIFTSLGSAAYYTGIRNLTKTTVITLESIGYVVNYRFSPKPELNKYRFSKEEMVKNRDVYLSKPYNGRANFDYVVLDYLDNKKVMYFNKAFDLFTYINSERDDKISYAAFNSLIQKNKNRKVFLCKGLIVKFGNDTKSKDWGNFTVEDVYNSKINRSLMLKAFEVKNGNNTNIYLSIYHLIKALEPYIINNEIYYTSTSRMSDTLINNCLDKNSNIIVKRLNKELIKI